jgi:hypothetical protein
MTKITPTLGQLRERLHRDGMPGPHEEFTFDLSDEAAPGYLPDCWVVARRTCELLFDGRYDHLSDQTPLEELDV